MSRTPSSVTRTAEAATKDARISSQAVLSNPYVRAALPFVNGGLAGMAATACIQPIDMIKVRLQLAGEGHSGTTSGPKPSALTITRNIIASGRALDLYTGLSAGLLRQAVYTTARIGLFDTFMNAARARSPSPSSTGFKERAAAGLSAGAIAALISNPADLALIRMQSDGLKPAAQRAHYRSVVDALSRIVRAEGIAAWWAGCAPTVARAMALNFGQLAFFSEAKTQIRTRTSLDPTTTTLAASAVAGFFASFFSLPFDFVKTRLQRQVRGQDGSVRYKGVVDCAVKVVREEGWGRFYRGFGTYYVRIAPHAMITLIVADWLGFMTR